MTVAPNSFNGWGPDGNSSQLPPGASPPLVAAPTTPVAGQGQLVVYNAAGDAQIADGTVPGLVAAGRIFPDKITPLSAVDGAASANVWTGMGQGDKSSVDAGDGFTKADTCTPAYAKDGNTLGKLSSTRTLMGLVFGVAGKDNYPISWTGPAAQAVARSVMANNAALFGQHAYLVDAGAATDLTEIQFSQARAPIRGVITGIQYVANATLAATGGTDYKTLTVTKYAADGTTPVVVGTMTTVLVQTKWVAKDFTLSAVAGALNVLEGDQFTIQNSHAGSGAVTPAGVIRIVGKAI